MTRTATDTPAPVLPPTMDEAALVEALATELEFYLGDLLPPAESRSMARSIVRSEGVADALAAALRKAAR